MKKTISVAWFSPVVDAVEMASSCGEMGGGVARIGAKCGVGDDLATGAFGQARSAVDVKPFCH